MNNSIPSNLISLLCFFFLSIGLQGQEPFQVKGLCIAAPQPQSLDGFIDFAKNELAPNGINTLVLRIDYRYEYESRPELIGENPLRKEQVKKLVNACREVGIEIIPQVNLLGHQSWHSKASKLLEVYPEFDETPNIKLPEKYEWPNDDGLYCKSYCPLHPEVHEVVFDLVDEIVAVFEAKTFHAGMDEVFYLAHEDCPRCRGLDPARLFADEVRKIRDHLAETDTRLWIWGDRLIDGAETGIGMWEASMNNTARAIDMIPKDVVITDWHYERADPTPAYFATKGFDVIACPWRLPKVASDQVQMIADLKANSTKKMADRFLGVMHTYWSSAEQFMKAYKDPSHKLNERGHSPVLTFRAMTSAIKERENVNTQ
ncbi:family 20 glycosylhydrolase [Allomuricauda sp. SCSIO 65647]|uniref:family 20 glycosylhydrolase n=1 Tax=Allomuricauda sp. SCSIO 65647 TaxID=2908843 RepID=UPI001F4029A4|nr:family 20 glycosylhydrolase [Muricauda sp. SCSIO 65647]UJH67179.1 family 20 glycosylhydrolase [Muricauda sp. SCSIO 65647]